MTQRCRCWCFTLNNYTDVEREAIHSLSSHEVNYYIYGIEVGESGTPHLQGYLEVPKPLSRTAIKKMLFNNAKHPIHLEGRKGNRKQAIDYCKKDGEFFETCFKEPQQGRRTDWDNLYECIQECPSWDEIAYLFPEMALKYPNGIDRIINSIKNVDMKNSLKDEFKRIVFRPWQKTLVEELQQDANDRSIIWYCDPNGNEGKSYISKYLLAQGNCALLTNGRSTDIAHAYNGERTVIFDFSRTTEGSLNYSVIENIKNGVLFSPKYNSQTKVFVTPHIICMANFMPSVQAMSEDRWDIREITGGLVTKVPIGVNRPHVPSDDGQREDNIDKYHGL